MKRRTLTATGIALGFIVVILLGLGRTRNSGTLLVATTETLRRVATSSLATSNATASTSPEGLCQAAKLKSVGTTTKAMLLCHSSSAQAGLPADQTCLTAPQEKLASTFTKLDTSGGCVTVGDAATVSSAISTFVSDVASVLRPSQNASKCQGAKLKAVAAGANALLKAHAKNRKIPDSQGLASTVSKADTKLLVAFETAQREDDCQTHNDSNKLGGQLATFALREVAALYPWPPQLTNQGGVTLALPPNVFTDVSSQLAQDGGVAIQLSTGSGTSSQIVVSIAVMPKDPQQSFDDWFIATYDSGNLLLPGGTYRREFSPDGRSLLFQNGPTPDNYEFFALPYVILMSPSGTKVATITLAQDRNLADLGYPDVGALLATLARSLTLPE